MTTTKSFVLGVLLLVPVSVSVSVWAGSGQQDGPDPCRAPGQQCEDQRECRRNADDVDGEQAYRTCLALRDKARDDCAAQRDSYERCMTSARSADTRPVDSVAGGDHGETGHDAGDGARADNNDRGRHSTRDR